MNGQKFLEELEHIDTRLVEKAAVATGESKRRRLAILGSLAAAACILLVAGIILFPSPTATIPHVTGSSGDIPPGGAVAVEGGVYIDKIELPEQTDPGVSLDMIGLIVYKGRIYTQAEYLECSAEQKELFAGEYLGTAKGNIDEWSSQDDYAVELASNVPGDVYSVNGYDVDFRICIKGMYNGDGYIYFFENLNGVTLRTGSDLYCDRLKLDGGYDSVTYQLHDDWDWAVESYHPLAVSQETLDGFLTELYAASFVDTNAAGLEIYSIERQGHLWFTMKDGTHVGLRLIEGGYVRYSSMSGGAAMVYMPGDAFDAMLDACTR